MNNWLKSLHKVQNVKSVLKDFLKGKIALSSPPPILALSSPLTWVGNSSDLRLLSPRTILQIWLSGCMQILHRLPPHLSADLSFRNCADFTIRFLHRLPPPHLICKLWFCRMDFQNICRFCIDTPPSPNLQIVILQIQLSEFM